MLRHSFFFLLTSLLSLSAHPVPESAKWLTYSGGEGPGKGKHVVLIAADQEYRSEQAMPMMAGILSKHHGFDCTVLFGVNEKGMVDPTMPVYPKKGKEDETCSPSNPDLPDHLGADRHKRLAPLVRKGPPLARGAVPSRQIGQLA